MRPYEHRTRATLIRRCRPIIATLAGLGLVAGLLTACSRAESPEQAVDAFLRGWQDGKLDQLRFDDTQGQGITGARVAEEIKLLSGELTAKPRRDGDAQVREDAATANLTIDWTLPGGTHWAYPSAVRLKRDAEDHWRIIWERGWHRRS